MKSLITILPTEAGILVKWNTMFWKFSYLYFQSLTGHIGRIYLGIKNKTKYLQIPCACDVLVERKCHKETWHLSLSGVWNYWTTSIRGLICSFYNSFQKLAVTHHLPEGSWILPGTQFIIINAAQAERFTQKRRRLWVMSGHLQRDHEAFWLALKPLQIC